MTLGQVLLNLLFAALAFFIGRWLLGLILPDDMRDKEKVTTIVGVILAVIVFFLNFAASIVVTKT